MPNTFVQNSDKSIHTLSNSISHININANANYTPVSISQASAIPLLAPSTTSLTTSIPTTVSGVEKTIKKINRKSEKKNASHNNLTFNQSSFSNPSQTCNNTNVNQIGSNNSNSQTKSVISDRILKREVGLIQPSNAHFSSKDNNRKYPVSNPQTKQEEDEVEIEEPRYISDADLEKMERKSYNSHNPHTLRLEEIKARSDPISYPYHDHDRDKFHQIKSHQIPASNLTNFNSYKNNQDNKSKFIKILEILKKEYKSRNKNTSDLDNLRLKFDLAEEKIPGLGDEILERILCRFQELSQDDYSKMICGALL